MGHVTAKIIKADSPVSISSENKEISIFSGIERPYNCDLLEQLVRESTILPQCINAYKRNIAGFGVEPKYLNESIEPSDEMKSEFELLENILQFLSFEKPIKEVFEEIIREREIFGYSFLEIVCDETTGLPIELANVESSTIEILKKDEKYTEYNVTRCGKTFTRRRQFRKYKQKVGSEKIYFKEFGDPRKLDMYSGEYSDDVPNENQANSLIHFNIGHGTYGTPRWEGPMLTIQGARKAEKLNWNYFENGRHTPMMIVVQGGTLTDDSWAKISEYSNSIKGEQGQHAFLVLEAERLEGETAFDDKEKVNVEIKSLADVLQKDELFQDYLENHRRKSQSSFNLPDIYVGYSGDYNVATAKEVIRKTEEQVFVPERESLEWIVNNKILGPYGFKHVWLQFKSPDVENTDHQYKMFSVASKFMSPNQVFKEYYNSINRPFEPLQDEWADIPQYVFTGNQEDFNIETFTSDIVKKYAKGKESNPDTIQILKSIQKDLKSINQNGVGGYYP